MLVQQRNRHVAKPHEGQHEQGATPLPAPEAVAIVQNTVVERPHLRGQFIGDKNLVLRRELDRYLGLRLVRRENLRPGHDVHHGEILISDVLPPDILLAVVVGEKPLEIRDIPENLRVYDSELVVEVLRASHYRGRRQCDMACTKMARELRKLLMTG